MTVASKRNRNFLVWHLVSFYTGILLVLGGSEWIPRSPPYVGVPLAIAGTGLVFYCVVQLYRDYFRRRKTVTNGEKPRRTVKL